jgi:gliding motility-associated-like protein
MRLAFFILFLSLSASVFAQGPYPSVLGRFQVNEKKGCAPFTVVFTKVETVTGAFLVDFLGNGYTGSAPDDSDTSPATFTYTTPGKYKLLYTRTTSGIEVDEIEIEVVANIAPAFELYTCNGNAVQVNVTDTDFDTYQITYNNGAPITVPKGSLARDNETLPAGTNTIAVQGLNSNAADNCATATKNFTAIAALPVPSLTSLTSISASEIDLSYTLAQNVLGRIEIAINNNPSFQQATLAYADSRDTIQSVNNETTFYCFRIGAVDACTNAVSYSSSVCSMVLNATAKDGFNQLDWTTKVAGIVNYSVNRDAQVGYAGLGNIVVTYNDVDVTCNVEYCYQLTANYAGATSTSLSKCVTSFTTQKPPTITDLLASFDAENAVEVDWIDAVEAVDYSIFKNTGGGSYFLASSQAEPPYSDASFDFNAPSCYEVLYEDACNNVSNVSTEVCPVVLTASLDANNVVTLSWSNYVGWQNGVSQYRLEKYTESGALLRGQNLGMVNTYVDDENDLFNQVAYYRITALANDPVGPSFSNRVAVIKEPNLFYPKAFTPNGDNLNDTFKVFGQYIAGFEMQIFNRWGELVFATDKISEGWDGTFRGKKQPESTYTFVATIMDFAGRKVKRSGSIVLLTKDK